MTSTLLHDATTRSPCVLPPWAARCSVRLPPDADAETLIGGIPLPDALQRAVPSRQMQFRAGRFCARQALRELGFAAGPVPRGATGAPIWPEGVIGSITHTDDFASAAVARLEHAGAIGIDSELVVSPARAASVSRVVATLDELAGVRHAGIGWLEALTLVFSAKEAAFKCLHPFVGRVFGFHAVRIEQVDVATGRFEAHVVEPLCDVVPAGTTLGGRFEIEGGRVHTGVALACGDRDAALW